MYIVAIGWLYVTVLMSLAEAGWVAGILTFVFYGFLPVTLVLWLFGGATRRRRNTSTANGRKGSHASGACPEVSPIIDSDGERKTLP